ncbi:MAG: translation initiation factor IF-6 [Candidatus Bilamarchaeaceae archaeon]
MTIERHCAYYGNPWVGMFIKGNDEFTFIPIDASDKLRAHIERFLRTKVVRTTVGESNLLGVYIAMNSNGVILPNIAAKKEVERFRSLGLNVYVSEDKHNAHGNNIAVNNKGGIVNSRVPKNEQRRISDVLDVELVPMSIAGYHTVGSACLATDRGFLTHYKTSEDEMKTIESALRVKGTRGTVNTGIGFVSYGIVANRKGYIAGEQTTAFELGRLVEAMDF